MGGRVIDAVRYGEAVRPAKRRSITGRTRAAFRAIGLMGVVLMVSAVLFAGWRWIDRLAVRQVIVVDARHADEETIFALARVDSGGRMLDVDPVLAADRVIRAPWVRSADVRRLPSGVVAIAVEERQPVILALGADDRPAAYLDREGYVMPLVEGVAWDVPLLRGVAIPENHVRPVDSAPLLELLAVLPNLDPLPAALVSSFEVGPGGVLLHTSPAGSQSTVDVLLGHGEYARKFTRLDLFWRQAVLSRPDVSFASIDLRFDGQIVTRES